MLVSLFVDASWCPRTKAGGWGCWVKSQRTRRGVTGSGRFTSFLATSSIAEVLAIANAVLFGLRGGGHVLAGDDVLVQTDCEHAIRVYDGRQPGSVLERRARDRLKGYTTDRQVTFRFRHVKGHTTGDTPRTWVNTECDRLARLEMRAAR